MQVGHGGLEVIMAQAVFDITCGLPPGEHMHGTGMAKGVHGIDASKTFRGQGQGEIFPAEAIEAVSGEFLTALIDKEALLVGGFWARPESSDIELKELSGFGLQFDETKAVSFSEDGEGFVLGVEVVQVQSGHFACPGPRIEQEVEEGVIAGTFFSLQIDRLKDLEDLLGVEEPDEGFLDALLGDGENGFCQFSLVRIKEADHFGEGFEGGQSLIASFGQVVTMALEIIEEGEDEIRCDLFQPEGFDFDAVVICGKEEKELENIAVGFEGVIADSLDVREVAIEELVDGGG